jgi:hypothetical protein
VFLETAASLSPATFISWDALYTKDAAQAFMQSPEGVKDLLPRGPHPVVMDPANPTNNVAACLWDVRPLRELAEQLLEQGSGGAAAGGGSAQRAAAALWAVHHSTRQPGRYISEADKNNRAV